MKTIEEKIAVMQAFVDGGQIEYYDITKKSWIETSDPSWNWSLTDYRVKEESKQPEYVPFTFEDAEFLIGKVVIHKSGTEIRLITVCSPITVEGICYTILFSEYTFPDGSPCGKLKE